MSQENKQAGSIIEELFRIARLPQSEREPIASVLPSKRLPNGRPYEPLRRPGARRVSALTLHRAPAAEPTRSREYHAEQYVKLFRQEQLGATVGQIEAGFKSDARAFMPDGRRHNSGAKRGELTQAIRAGLEAKTPRKKLQEQTYPITKAQVEKDFSLGAYRIMPDEAMIKELHKQRFKSALSRIRKEVTENF